MRIPAITITTTIITTIITDWSLRWPSGNGRALAPAANAAATRAFFIVPVRGHSFPILLNVVRSLSFAGTPPGLVADGRRQRRMAFHPGGTSGNEERWFRQRFVLKVFRHIGPCADEPAVNFKSGRE